MNLLHELVGMKILEIEPVLDYWQIVVSGACVSAYNPMGLSHAAPQLLGLQITGVEFQENEALRISLSQGKSISITLEPDQFTGPEAFNVHFTSGQILVG